MHRLYVEEITETDGLIRLSGQNAHYLTNVLRQREGDNVLLFDSSGQVFDATITDAGAKEVVLKLTLQYRPKEEQSVAIVLCQGLIKGTKMDYVVEKATECGVSEIIPFYSTRCQFTETRKLARWNKIAIEASRQSQRVTVPVIKAPVSFSDLLSMIKNQTDSRSYIFYEKGGTSLKSQVLPDDIKTIYTIVGSEGGFSPQEISEAEATGVTALYLGSRVLRSETASLASVLLLQFMFGDMVYS
ncbi:16S rRNA (uracil(1498)-N(3))-methyltransferase [Candidatus Magnetomonas plexicatena]|uniref:16S rRNA (uracil(1498)-N(3))-methyltransferase n=1 Tax=Candidatus Magnetomonas plexicatena TaxID=2552947 RepID=UPI001C7508B8|nr:16S rRNA (uracil(1498)-N(3))-methyltransferase [Nitrospirales bacterium LBB_01]